MRSISNIPKFLALGLILSSLFSQSGRDISDTEVNAFAYRGENDEYTTVEVSVNIFSSDYNAADGVRFNFWGANVYNAFIASEFGQNAAVIIDGGEVVFGDTLGGMENQLGIFENGYQHVFIIHVDSSASIPMQFEYTIYDDGWAQGFCLEDQNCDLCNDYGIGINCEGEILSVELNAEGVISIDEIEVLEAPNQSPSMLGLYDIPNDQGKSMIVSWEPGDLVDLPYFTEFSVQRYSPDESGLNIVESNVFLGEYFSSPGTGSSPEFGEFLFSREDSLINFNFDSSEDVPADDFQVRWTGDVNIETAGVYTFRTFSDDGVRLFVNGNLIIDKWFDFAMTSHFGSINLGVGSHTIVLEYYENGGEAECYLYWSSPYNAEETLVEPTGTSLLINEMGTWDYLSTIPWHGNEEYATVVSTLEDKTPTAFRVIAHTENPNVFFYSEPIIGRSFDNIGPPPPSGVVATVNDTIVSLSWNPSNTEDFNYYSVHRSSDSLFQLNADNFLFFTSNPNAIDEQAPWNVPLYYRVRSTDFGGNFGPGSEFASAIIYVNRPPQAFDVAISPAIPGEDEDINLSYSFYDPDQDTEEGTIINWFKNGFMLSTITGNVFPSNITSCGDEIYAVVKPADGSLFGAPIQSNTVIICGENTAPVWIDSLEHVHILEDSQNNIYQLGDFVYDAQQANSQLIFSVTGNTNEEVISAHFEGSSLLLSASAQNYNGSPASTLTLNISDGYDNSEIYVDVSIDSVNDSPQVLEFVGSDNFHEDESYVFELFDFVIEDPDNDNLDMSMTVLPGENYTPSLDTLGLIHTPQNFNGDIVVRIEIADGSGGLTFVNIPMNVIPVNDPAFMITTSLDIINNGPATEEQEYNLVVSWKDIDGSEDAGAYDITISGPASNWLEIDNVYSSGEVNNFQYNAIIKGTPDDINMIENDISISILDNSEGQEEDFTEYFYIATISVNDAPDVFSYNGPIDLDEDEHLMISVDQFTVEDPDNSPIDFNLEILSGENYSADDTMGVIFPDGNFNGELTINVLINDGDKSDYFSFIVMVHPVNDQIEISEVGNLLAEEEDLFSTVVTWTDVDGSGNVDDYSVYLDGSASNWLDIGDIIFVSNTDTADFYVVGLSGTPDDINLYQTEIVMTVIDNSEGGTIENNIYFSVMINAVNDTPMVMNYNGPVAVDEDQIFFTSINNFIIEDPDSDFPFDFSYYINPGVNYTVAEDSLSIIPDENYNGNIEVNFMVSDGLIDVPYTVMLEVIPVNDNPILNVYNGIGRTNEDTPIVFSSSDFSISDPDENQDNQSSYVVNLQENDNYTANGSTLIPDHNYYGELDVIVSVSDNNGGTSNTISFNVIVDPVNDAPEALNVAISPAVPNENDYLTLSYMFYDIDEDSPQDPEVQWFKNGTWQENERTLVLNNNLTSCDDSWYAVVTPFDGVEYGQSYTSNSVTICGANTAPVWEWTTPIRIYEDSTLAINLYDNMTDEEHAASQITYTILSQANPELINAAIEGSELLLETLVQDYVAAYADTLLMKADDSEYQDTVEVVINIAPVNDAPLANDDSYNVEEGGVVSIDNGNGLLANDVDVDGDPLTLVLVNDPVNGQLVINTDNSFSYTHNGDETNSDSFTYMAFDGEYYSNLALVTLSISPVNDAPVIVYAAEFETLEEQSFDMVINDFIIEDPDSDFESMELQVLDGENYVSSTVESGFTITPLENYFGELVIPVTVSDGDSTSAIFQVFALVVGDNDAPEVVNALEDILVDEDSDPVGINLIGSSDSYPYFDDIDGDNLVFSAHTNSGIFHALIDGDSLFISFEENEFGNDSLFIIATDPSGEFAVDTIVVHIEPVNDAPEILAAANIITNEDEPVQVNINDFVYVDIDSDESSLSLILAEGEGYNLSMNEDFVYTITPNPDAVNELSVPASISDGESISNIWDLLVVVLSDNDAPVVVYQADDIVVEEDSESVIISLLGAIDMPYFSDSDGDTLDFDVYTIGDGVVSAMVDFDSLYLYFEPNMFGSDSVFIIATDPAGDSVEDTVLVTVNSVNDAPVIYDAMSFEVFEDDSIDIVIFNFVVRDDDSPDEDLSISVSGENTQENFEIVAIEYGYRIIPLNNFFGEILLSIVVSDGLSNSEPWLTDLIVLPVNDNPEIVNHYQDIEVDEDADTLAFSLLGTMEEPYFIDVDGDSLDFNVYNENTELIELHVDDYEVELVFAANMFGLDTITMVATDGTGEFISDTVVVTVNAVNDAPMEFSLLSPSDGTEVVVTPISADAGEAINVSWSASQDVEGDEVEYGFILYSGPYVVSTELYNMYELTLTELSLPHTAAIGLLETAGYQHITCDWMVFATDGQDTTYSSEVWTITIDARQVLSADDSVVPEVFALHQNYPNPFNPTTTLKYDLPEAVNVRVMIYDLMGRKIRSLVNERQDAGFRSVQWNAADDLGLQVSAGMYIYTIHAGDFVQTRKMILLK